MPNGSYFFNLDNRDFGHSSRPTQMSTFVLSYSKFLMNRAIEIMFGEDRHSDPTIASQYCPLSGDTDSVVTPACSLKRLLDYDRGKDEKQQILAYQNTIDPLGKFTEELADYLLDENIVSKGDYGGTFPDFESGFVCRLVAMRMPQPKSYCCKYLYPPKEYQGEITTKYNFDRIPMEDWNVGYKFKCKGVPKGCMIYPKGASIHPHFKCKIHEECDCKPDSWPIAQDWSYYEPKDCIVGNNKYSFDCMWYCLERGIPMISHKPERISRTLDRTTIGNEEDRFTMKDDTMTRMIFNSSVLTKCREKILWTDPATLETIQLTVPPGFDPLEKNPKYHFSKVNEALTKAQCTPRCPPDNLYCCMFKQFT
jgi:hypothetical protein